MNSPRLIIALHIRARLDPEDITAANRDYARVCHVYGRTSAECPAIYQRDRADAIRRIHRNVHECLRTTPVS